jgi:hypothetical protein
VLSADGFCSSQSTALRFSGQRQQQHFKRSLGGYGEAAQDLKNALGQQLLGQRRTAREWEAVTQSIPPAAVLTAHVCCVGAFWYAAVGGKGFLQCGAVLAAQQRQQQEVQQAQMRPPRSLRRRALVQQPLCRRTQVVQMGVQACYNSATTVQLVPGSIRISSSSTTTRAAVCRCCPSMDSRGQ